MPRARGLGCEAFRAALTAKSHGAESSADEARSSRSAGDVWALWHLWHSLGLEDLSLAWGRTRSEIDVLACLRLMVFNRLCDPASKLGVLRWLQTVALPRGFGFAEAPPDHQHLLRAMDVLDDHSAAIGERLSLLLRPLVDVDMLRTARACRCNTCWRCRRRGTASSRTNCSNSRASTLPTILGWTS